MRMKYVLTITVALTASVGNAQTDQTGSTSSTAVNSLSQPAPATPLYRGQEVSLDLFGSYINPEGNLDDLFKTSIRHGQWGGGAGLNYFLTRSLGIGTDFNASEHPGSHWGVDYWVGNIYLRLPLGDTGLAPYIYGGGGRGMSPVWQWVYGGGPGLEMRFTRNVGIFSDARFLWSHQATSLNTLTIRAGIRLAF